MILHFKFPFSIVRCWCGGAYVQQDAIYVTLPLPKLLLQHSLSVYIHREKPGTIHTKLTATVTSMGRKGLGFLGKGCVQEGR